MNRELRSLLEASFPGQDDRFFTPMFIGGTSSAANEGAFAILSGRKTATSSPFWDYPDGRIPFPGALSILLDGQERPVGIVETQRVEVMPFNSAREDFARSYGEWDLTLETWRIETRAWYEASAARHRQIFSDETPIICEWFAVVRRF
jgi:uncharacterized protein YhfF